MVTVPTVRPAPVIAEVAAALRQADDARHRDLRRTGRDDERDGAAGDDLRAADGRLADHRAGGHRGARLGGDRADRQTRTGDRRRRRGLREADDARHRDLRRTGRDDERYGAADDDLRAGRRDSS